MINIYSRVQLITDRFRQEGAAKGAFGYVIDVYDNGDCEVEFSDEGGNSYAQIVATQADFKQAEPEHIDKSGIKITIVKDTFGPTSSSGKVKAKALPFRSR